MHRQLIANRLTGRCAARIVATMPERVYKPRWTCRLHVSHRWRTYRSSDGGGQYQECLDCGSIATFLSEAASSASGGGGPQQGIGFRSARHRAHAGRAARGSPSNICAELVGCRPGRDVPHDWTGSPGA